MATTLTPQIRAAAHAEPGRAWTIRLTAARTDLDPEIASLLRTLAELLDQPGTRIHDVEELDQIVLDPEAPFSHLVVLGRDQNVYTARQDPHDADQVLVVRQPALSEAASADYWSGPLAFPSHQLDQALFPVTVLVAPDFGRPTSRATGLY